MNDQDLTAREARRLLAEYAEWHSRRDEIIGRAYAAGLTVTEIWQTTGHAKTTITTILDRQENR